VSAKLLRNPERAYPFMYKLVKGGGGNGAASASSYLTRVEFSSIYEPRYINGCAGLVASGEL